MKRFTILSILFLITLQAGGKQAGEEATMIGKTVSADKVEIVYTAKGSGKTAVIFIHGGFADRDFWVEQVGFFGKKYRAIAVDLAGHGDSGKNRTHWNLASFAEDVRAVMEKENIHRAVLVGNSLGGPVALETACLVPDRVACIVGVDTFQVFDIQPPPDYFKNQAAALRNDFKGTMEKMVHSLFKPGADTELVARVEKVMLDNSPEMAAELTESFTGFSMVDALKKLRQPIRCINGDLYPTQVEKNREIYPDFDAVIIPDTGHYPMLERPQKFNGLLEAILEKEVK
jgi:pimeloyl-ACP methyl ester carboxylesterase